MIQTVGLSPLDSSRCDMVLDLPPHSPVTHGFLRLRLELDGDIVQTAEPVLGSMHRGAEKLFESRDYRQILGLANRHEWLASFAGELGVAMLVERALGLEAPEHAAWLRTMLLEFHRVTSHLAFLGGHPDLATESIAIRQLRDEWVTLLQDYAGTRMHTMLAVVGGVARQPSAQWLEAARVLAARTIDDSAAVVEAAAATPGGDGIIDRAAVATWALSGPVARAASMAIDIRASEPALRYAQLAAHEVVTGDTGDARGRLVQLAREVTTAAACVAEAAPMCQSLGESPINVLLPKVLRVPVGEYDRRIETPLGIAHWLLASTGDKMPQRLALRPASLHTVLALETALVGAQVSRVAAIVASMPFLTGDAER